MGFAPPFARMKQIVREHFANMGPPPVAPAPVVVEATPVAYPDPSWLPEPEVEQLPPPPAVIVVPVAVLAPPQHTSGDEDSQGHSEGDGTLPPDYKMVAMRRPDLDILAQHHGIVDPLVYETKNQLIQAIKRFATPHQ